MAFVVKLAGGLNVSRWLKGTVQRPQDQTRNSHGQEKRGNHPFFRVPQTLRPGEFNAVALAFSADIFPIPILVAKVALNGRSAGRTSSQKNGGFLRFHTGNLSIIKLFACGSAQGWRGLMIWFLALIPWDLIGKIVITARSSLNWKPQAVHGRPR